MISPIQTLEDEVSDEEFLPCWTCQVFTLHYILFGGNAKTTLILSDGYRRAVTSDKFCEQTAIEIGKGVLKGILRSADLVNECIYMYSFWLMG